MGRRTRRTIYDNDGTTVTETVGASDGATVFKSGEGTHFDVSDVLDTFAGYLLPRFKIEKQSGSGKCMICGKDTAYPVRKVCVDCMDKYSDDLYQQSKEASSNGNTGFELR